jgi:Ca2+-binding RTX toxin-like protein
MDFSATSTALLTNYGGADFNIDNPLADDGVSYFSTVKDISQVVLSGGSANDTLAGTYGVDTLTGNGGDDRLYGFLGADIMKGGAGNDSYFVDNAGDVVTELANQGTDTVNTSINYTLGANVENLTAYPATGNITLTGNGLANEVQGAIDWGNTAYGLAGDDKLCGGRANDVMDGGTGADYMMGDLGNDT